MEMTTTTKGRVRKVVVRMWNKNYGDVETMKEFKSKKKAIEYIDLYKLQDDVVTGFEIKNSDGTKDLFIDVK